MPDTYLPDVDSESWAQYSADQFTSSATDRINALAAPPPPDPGLTAHLGGGPSPDEASAGSMTDTHPPPIASGPSPEPAPAAPAPALPTPPAPTSAPQPPTQPAPAPASAQPDWIAGALNAVDQAGGDVQKFAQGLQTGAGDLIGSALNAADAAGADVQKFVSALPPVPGVSTPTSSAGPASTDEQTAYIRQAAAARGIDPDIAVKVASSEGLNTYVGDNNSSFGPFQLHYGGVASGGNAVPGLGDAFTQQTGLDARDPSTWRQQVDFALNQAAQGGWTPWHGAAAVGIGPRQGISSNAAPGPVTVADQADRIQTQTVSPSTSALMSKVQPFLGNPYVWGGKDPNTGFDCSGFVGYVEGTGQPESTTTLYAKSGGIDQKSAQPGDLVFYNMGQSDMHLQHVGVYLGNGKIAQAGGTQDTVNVADVNQKVGSAPEFRRLDAGSTPPTAGQPAQVAQVNNDPIGWLGQQKDALTSSIGSGASALGSTVQGWTDNLGTLKDAALGQSVTQPVATQTTPSDSLTDPLGTRYTLSPTGQPVATTQQSTPAAPQDATSATPAPQGPLEAVKQKFSDAIDALGSFLTPHGANGEPLTPMTQPQMDTAYQNSGVRLPTSPLDALGGSSLGEPTGGEQATAERNAAIAQANPLRDVPVVGGATTLAAQTALDPTNLLLGAGPELGRATGELAGAAGDVARNALESPAVQDVVSSRQLGGGRPFAGPEPAQPTYQSVMPAGTFETPPAPASGIGDTVANVQRNLTRAFTDRQVDVNQVQQAYQKALGRPLNADEMAAELQRLSPDAAASVKIDEGLKPAIQSVGNDYQALRDYVTLRSNVEVADTLGNDARNFSGGMTAADSQQAIQTMQDQLGPQRFAKVQQAADQVTSFNQDLRQRLVDSGVLSQDQASQLDTMYPNWAKTRILDYMADPAGGQGAGTKIGLADRNLRQYTLEGTTRAREDPIASTVAYAHQVERMANKNEAFNAMQQIDQASPNPQLRPVPQDFSPTKDQVTMVGFQNGQKLKYVTDNKALGEAINGTGTMSTPSWVSGWSKFVRATATSRNPLFLAGNAALDIPTYAFRSTIREGGPTPPALGRVFSELAKGYADAFQGLLQGEYRGAGTSAFLKAGGGQSGYFMGGEGETAQRIADLQRSNIFQVNSKADLLRLTKDVLTLKPVEGLGERIELGPRVAAYNLAKQRGANPVQAATEGRTVTVDFSQGGTFTKYINNFIPFFNVGFQGPAQLIRAFRENPKAFVATTGTLIGLPSVAAEVWNHADPQRWQDYQDVPDYVKNQGIVIMSPGDTAVDAQGNRKPGYAVLKLREWAPFAQIARSAADVAFGDNQRTWQQMAASIGTGLSPTNATSISQVGSEPLAGIPALPAALQLQQNRDFFRSRDIVTTRNDQNASALAKGLAPMMQRAVDAAGMNAEIRPSAIDFFIRDQAAGAGSAALGASDLAAGTPRQDTTAQSLPGVGGLIGRFSGSQTGQNLQSNRDVGLTPSAREILRSNGITTTPGAVSSKVNGIPLKLDEESRYQDLFNRYSDDAIQRAARSSDWNQLSQRGKESRVQQLIDAARSRAGNEVLNTLPAAEKQKRLRVGATAP